MAINIEGVYSKGMIKPLRAIKLKDNTKVVITIKNKRHDKGIISFAGSWKDYKTFDGRTLNDLKKDIYMDRKLSTRKEIKF